MSKRLNKIISWVVLISFSFTQTVFAQGISQINLANVLSRFQQPPRVQTLQLPHLRYFSFNEANNELRMLLDKGADTELNAKQVDFSAQELLKYFLIGISLPDSAFWVNLRPDAKDSIIDPQLARTDVGKIMLEADLQLKKDTALATSPESIEGKVYWDKLYKKAGELFGTENVSIPTLTRPWIVPQEVILREAQGSAYIYKATLKVCLEQDVLKDSVSYSFKDDRLKQLNDYSTQLIRETILPQLTKRINTAKEYAPLRQVFYSLIFSRWFKARFSGQNSFYARRIDSSDLSGLTSSTQWSQSTYFQSYKKSFDKGEYNLSVPVETVMGKTIRSFFSGGAQFTADTLNMYGNGAASFQGFRASSPVLPQAFISDETIALTGVVGANGSVKFTQSKSSGNVASSPLDEKQLVDKRLGQVTTLFRLAQRIDPDNADVTTDDWEKFAVLLNHPPVKVFTIVEDTQFMRAVPAMIELIKKVDTAGDDSLEKFRTDVLLILNAAQGFRNSGNLSASSPVGSYDAYQKAENKWEEIKSNLGLDIQTAPLMLRDVHYPGALGANKLWSLVLSSWRLNHSIFNRVEQVGKTQERYTGRLAYPNAQNDPLVGVLEEYDIHNVPGGIRTGEQMRPVLMDSSAAVTPEAYFMHRGFFASREHVQRAFYGPNKQRFDITVIPPALWGNEFAKTFGHYHDPVSMPEVYQVVSGEIMWLMQKTDEQGNVVDFITVRAKAGDIAIMLPGYGHVSVNLSETEPAVMANWLTWHQASSYGSFGDKRGAAYYVVKNADGKTVLVPNHLYGKLPSPRQMQSKDTVAVFGLKRGVPIYNLVRLSDTEFNQKTRFLYHPDEFMNELTVGRTLDEAAQEQQLPVVASASSPITNGEFKYPYSAFSIPLIEDESTLKAIEDHMVLVQAGKNYLNGKAEGDRTAALINWMWTDLLRDQDPVGVMLHQEKLGLAAQFTSSLKAKDFKTAVASLTRYVEIRDELCRRWLSLALDAHNGVSGLPRYAYTYEQKMFKQQGYERLVDLFNTYGDNLRTISPYTLEPIASLVAAAKKEGIAIMPLGAGGPGANCIAVSSQGANHLRTFFENHGVNLLQEAEASKIVRGDDSLKDQKVTLKGYMPFKVGREPLAIAGFDKLPGVNLPVGPDDAAYNPQTGELRALNPGETAPGSWIKGKWFNPRTNFKQGTPLETDWITPRLRISAEEARKLISSAQGGLEVVAHLRGVDGCGSSLDLPEFQIALTKDGAKLLMDLPSTPTIASDFSVKITFGLASNEHAIVYEAPDYFSGEYSVTDVELVNHPDADKSAAGIKMPKFGQKDAPAYIFKNIFGLSGIKIKCEKISPMALAGGMESSNAFNVALIAAASMLSGADLNLAEIFNLAVKLENDELNGLTGGQGHLSSMLGGAYQHVWLSGVKKSSSSSPAEVMELTAEQKNHLINILNNDRLTFNKTPIEYLSGTQKSPLISLLAAHAQTVSAPKIADSVEQDSLVRVLDKLMAVQFAVMHPSMSPDAKQPGYSQEELIIFRNFIQTAINLQKAKKGSSSPVVNLGEEAKVALDTWFYFRTSDGSTKQEVGLHFLYDLLSSKTGISVSKIKDRINPDLVQLGINEVQTLDAKSDFDEGYQEIIGVLKQAQKSRLEKTVVSSPVAQTFEELGAVKVYKSNFFFEIAKQYTEPAGVVPARDYFSSDELKALLEITKTRGAVMNISAQTSTLDRSGRAFVSITFTNNTKIEAKQDELLSNLQNAVKNPGAWSGGDTIEQVPVRIVDTEVYFHPTTRGEEEKYKRNSQGIVRTIFSDQQREELKSWLLHPVAIRQIDILRKVETIRYQRGGTSKVWVNVILSDGSSIPVFYGVSKDNAELFDLATVPANRLKQRGASSPVKGRFGDAVDPDHPAVSGLSSSEMAELGYHYNGEADLYYFYPDGKFPVDLTDIERGYGSFGDNSEKGSSPVANQAVQDNVASLIGLREMAFNEFGKYLFSVYGYVRMSEDEKTIAETKTQVTLEEIGGLGPRYYQLTFMVKSGTVYGPAMRIPEALQEAIDAYNKQKDDERRLGQNSSPIEARGRSLGTSNPDKFREVLEAVRTNEPPVAFISNKAAGIRFMERITSVSDTSFTGQSIRQQPNKPNSWSEDYRVSFDEIEFIGTESAVRAYMAQKNSGSVSSPVQEDQSDRKLGGIDFRTIPMTIQPVGGFSKLDFIMPKLTHVDTIDLNQELSQINTMVNGGILPSGERLKEYIAACYEKKASRGQLDALIPAVIKICKLQETQACEADSALQEVLVLLEVQ